MRQKSNLFLWLTVLQKAAMIMLLNDCSSQMMGCSQAGLSFFLRRLIAKVVVTIGSTAPICNYLL